MHNDHTNISEEEFNKIMAGMLGQDYELCLDAVKSIVKEVDKDLSSTLVQHSMILSGVFNARKSAVYITLCRYLFREFLDTYVATSMALCAQTDEQKRLDIRDSIVKDFRNLLQEIQEADPNNAQMMADLRRIYGGMKSEEGQKQKNAERQK